MLVTAFIMGLAGSLHCAGMCSPLAVAITNTNTGALKNRILYNFGRMSMYGILGGIVAAIGYVLPIKDFQNVLSIVLGMTLIVMATTGITGIAIPFVTKTVINFSATLKTIFSRFIQHKTPGALLLLGALNGLLPCGLTVIALSFCLTFTTPVAGFAFMFTFGIGTLPVMLGLVSVFGMITNRSHWNVKRITTGLLAISGVILIARVFLIHVHEVHQHADVVDIIICR
jgi:uncharacterized protein